MQGMLRVAFYGGHQNHLKEPNVHQVYEVIVAELNMKSSPLATFQCHKSYVSCQQFLGELCPQLCRFEQAMPTTDESLSIKFLSIFNQRAQRTTTHGGGLFDATFMRFSQRIC